MREETMGIINSHYLKLKNASLCDTANHDDNHFINHFHDVFTCW